MKDANGLYYYPNPNEPKARMYVRQGVDDIEFRLWQSDHPEVWEKHDWLGYSLIRSAAAMYKEMGKDADPLLLYDENVARALIQENR